jgi:4-amino-4-deoxy-L-arabinose transferase-like glycosyltransferase
VPADGRQGTRFVLCFVLTLVVVWSVLPALLQSVPHADNIEQLNWAHALQWGYVKHPPLPTWLVHAAVAVFGPSAFLTYLLAMACVGASLLILWRCARLLLDRDGALLVVLLTSADYYLMGRGSFLNHNTVMLPFVAAGAWAVLAILRGASWRAWGALGLVQACGLLTKYQMAIVIAAHALALIVGGAWRDRQIAPKLLLCATATLLPVLPHLAWVQAHEFSTFAYAGHSLLADLPAGERIVHTLGFIAQQIGRLAPALLALVLALALARMPHRHPLAAAPAPAEIDIRLRRAVTALALTPVALIIALALVLGVAPQNHWGASSTLLLPMLAVVALAPRIRPPTAAAIAATVAVQLAAIIWNVAAARIDPGFHHSFAARPLAAVALQYWREHAGAVADRPGQPRILIGPDWDAGAIALELPSHPSVISSGDPGQAPWISAQELAHCGALLLWRTGQDPAAQIGADFASRAHDRVHFQTSAPGGKVSQIEAAILPADGGACPP